MRNVDDLLHFGLLTEPEMHEYLEALDFLWRVRNELHLRAKRANDRMSFELQEDLAEALGYGSMAEALEEFAARPRGSFESREDRPDLTLADLRFEPDESDLPVERFMRDYYRHARAIKTYSELVIDQCARRVDPRAGEAAVVSVVEHGFRIVNDQLMIPHAAHLREDPLRVVEVFRVAQKHQVPLSRMAQRLVRENRHVLDEKVRSSAAASALFMEILDAEVRVTRSLTAMNETDVLAQLIPEWEHIVCRWQHVIYHTYTVDVHSIFLVEELRRLWRGKYARAMPELTELMREVEDRPALFLGCLLHDIGKGFGGDHSNKGVVRARRVVERLGLSAERAARVLFVVQHHLLMSHLAQSRDISDAKLILELAQVCGDRTNLRNLYLATFADIRASSVEGWTDWKGQLLRELFERTAEMLETGTENTDEAVALLELRVERRREGAREELLRAGRRRERRSTSFFDEMPRRYFLSHTPRQIARHARVVLRYGEGKKLATAHRSTRGRLLRVHPLHAGRARALQPGGRRDDGLRPQHPRVPRLHDPPRARARDLRDPDTARWRERAGDALAGGGVAARARALGRGRGRRSRAPAKASGRDDAAAFAQAAAGPDLEYRVRVLHPRRRDRGRPHRAALRRDADARRAGGRDLHLEGRDHQGPGHGRLLRQGRRGEKDQGSHALGAPA